MRARLAKVGVVLLVVGAGCNVLAPTTQNPTTSTATPAPVPSASPALIGLVPPGVGRTGVTDPRELAAAHCAGLTGMNYTRTIRESTWWQNESVHWQRTRMTAVDGARVFAVLDQSGTPVLRDTPLDAAHVELYARLQPSPDGSRVAAALTDGGRTRYRTFPDTGHLVDDCKNLALLLSTFDARIVSRDHRGETTVFHLEATGPPVVKRFRFVPTGTGSSDPRNVTFEFLVDGRGIIHRYHLAYTVTVDGRALRYERTVHLSAIGTTSVRPPAWLDRVNATVEPAGTPTVNDAAR